MSVSVSSWFADKHIADILRRSAEMPLLPMLPTVANWRLESLGRETTTLNDKSETAGGGSGRRIHSEQEIEVTIAAVYRLLEGIGGDDIFSRVLRQRYTTVYGNLSGTQVDGVTSAEVEAWRELCTSERRAAALHQFGAENIAAVDALIVAKKALFAELGATGALNGVDAAAVRSEIVLDEAELTVALLLGDTALLRFFHACSAEERSTD